MSGVRAPLSCSPEEPGRLVVGMTRARAPAGAGGQASRGSVSVLSSLCLSLQELLTGTYAGGRQVMNEAEQGAHARGGKASVVCFLWLEMFWAGG